MAKKPAKTGPVRKQKNHEPSDKEAADGQFFKRVLHRAYLRDGDIVHTGEALALALLLHSQGKTKRGLTEVGQVAKMLDDPNAPTRRK